MAPPPRRPESAAGASLSVIRPKPPQDPIAYDPGVAARAGLAALTGRLDAVREALTASRDGHPHDRCRHPVLPGMALVELPDRLLADYGRDRPASELFAILRAARRIRDAVDRVVVLGGISSVLGTRALFESCCHPFHNELPRGERGGRPRLSFEGFSVDNDSAQAILDLVAPSGRPPGGDLLDRWALIVVGGAGNAQATAVATRLFLAALAAGVAGDRSRLAELVVPIAAQGDRLADLARTLGCVDTFRIPPGVDVGVSPFTAASLLPAAVAGMDVVRLLEGAAAMNRRFREAPVGSNPALDHAAVSHLAGEAGAGSRVLSIPNSRLESLGRWHARLFAAEPADRGSTDADGHGARVTHLVVGEPRRDRLVLPALGPFAHDEDGLDALVGTTWPALEAATARPRRPEAEIVLPRVDEHALGQVLQMLVLSSVVEACLGNPPSSERV